MWIELAQIVGGLVLLMVGADWLVRGAGSLALRVGISPLVVGLTVVAFGTSSPELVVGVKASLGGQGELTLGTVIGSNICNIVLILGISAVIRPLKIHLQVLRFDLPCMLGATVLVAGMLYTGLIGRGFGLVLVSTLVMYTTATILVAKREKPSVEETTYEESVSDKIYGWPMIGVLLLSGAALLVMGSDLILKGAVSVAERWGVSQAVIGLTLVAVGGSLPELATSLMAALKRKGDIAVGNVVGSNIFNLLSVLGLSALANPIPVTGIKVSDVAVMLVVSFLLFPLMRSGLELRRGEGSIMLVVYAGYVWYLFAA